MKTPKNVYFENVLSKEKCDTLDRLYLNHVKNGWGGHDHIGSSMCDPFKFFGFDESDMIQRLTILIQNHFPENLRYSHSYLRLYKNNHALSLHTDRDGLDITLSVNIGGLENWPLHISNVYSDEVVFENREPDSKFLENYSSFLTPKGCGVACYAVKFPHWRNKLVCSDDEYVLQIFYHWSILK